MGKYLFNINIAVNGILWLGALAVQISGWVNHAVAYVLFGIAFMWSIGTIIYWVKRRNRGNILREKGETNLEISIHCTEILRELHKRTLKLKDQAVKQYYRLFDLMDFWTLTNNLMNTMSKKEDKAVIAKAKKGAGKKKLSKKADKKRQQVDALFDSLRPIWDKEWPLANYVAWSNQLESLPTIQNSKYEGISKRRDEDKQWRKLFNELDAIRLKFAGIFVDKDLDKMIRDYLDYSHVGASLCFLTDLYNKYVPPDLLPSEYTGSGASRPYVEVQSCMTRLLGKIMNKINELQNVQKQKENTS